MKALWGLAILYVSLRWPYHGPTQELFSDAVDEARHIKHGMMQKVLMDNAQ